MQLNMVKKSDTPEPAIKIAEQPLKKKIAARIVKAPPDEPAQQSDATPPADVKVVSDRNASRLLQIYCSKDRVNISCAAHSSISDVHGIRAMAAPDQWSPCHL